MDERVKFEEWAKTKELPLRRWDVAYASEATEWAWEGWQARASLSTPQEQGWIACADRLPVEGQFVLCCYWSWGEPEREERLYGAARYMEGAYLDNENGLPFYPPTHWFPLPPPLPATEGDRRG